jgi:hypothetical protein
MIVLFAPKSGGKEAIFPFFIADPVKFDRLREVF